MGATTALRVAAGLVVAGAVSSGPIALALVNAIAPQPPWSDVGTFAANYDAVQSLPYVLGYVLLAGFVLFAGACHALAAARRRARTSAALVFTAAVSCADSLFHTGPGVTPMPPPSTGKVLVVQG